MINKKLDNIEEEIRQINDLINDNDYFKQIEKAIDIVNKKNDELSKKNKELQDRINKTIEYIEKYKTEDYCDGMSAKQLLDILKGE